MNRNGIPLDKRRSSCTGTQNLCHTLKSLYKHHTIHRKSFR